MAPTLTSDTSWVTEMLKLKSCAGSLLESCHLLPVTRPASSEKKQAGASVGLLTVTKQEAAAKLANSGGRGVDAAIAAVFFSFLF